MERYRSGHNGPDSKSGSPQGLVGSNPTRSASEMGKNERICPFFIAISQSIDHKYTVFRAALPTLKNLPPICPQSLQQNFRRLDPILSAPDMT